VTSGGPLAIIGVGSTTPRQASKPGAPAVGFEAVSRAHAAQLRERGHELLSRLAQDLGSMGIFIAIGIKPSRRVRLWCERVGGTLPEDVWPVLTELLDGAGTAVRGTAVRPKVTAPVEFALEGLVGAGQSTGFLEGRPIPAQPSRDRVPRNGAVGHSRAKPGWVSCGLG
jgi:hypothetical protein